MADQQQLVRDSADTSRVFKTIFAPVISILGNNLTGEVMYYMARNASETPARVIVDATVGAISGGVITGAINSWWDHGTKPTVEPSIRRKQTRTGIGRGMAIGAIFIAGGLGFARNAPERNAIKVRTEQVATPISLGR